MKQAVEKGTTGQVAILPLLVLLLAVVLCGCQSQPGSTPPPPTGGEESPSPAILRSVDYDVRETLTLVNQGTGRPSKQNLWVALIRDLPPYQTVRSSEITPKDYQLITDEYGNQVCRVQSGRHGARRDGPDPTRVSGDAARASL